MFSKFYNKVNLTCMLEYVMSSLYRQDLIKIIFNEILELRLKPKSIQTLLILAWDLDRCLLLLLKLENRKEVLALCWSRVDRGNIPPVGEPARKEVYYYHDEELITNSWKNGCHTNIGKTERLAVKPLARLHNFNRHFIILILSYWRQLHVAPTGLV